MEVDVFDIEGDGLIPTKIHCLVYKRNGAITATTNYEDMRKFFISSKIAVGHNIIRFDIPTVERLLNIKVGCQLIDTLALSWYLFPQRLIHGLGEWGEYFGVEKPPIDDWENLSSEEYIHRCTEDVKINSLLWDKQWNLLNKIYETEDQAKSLIKYLSFKMSCAALKEKSGWKIDVEGINNNISLLEKELEEKSLLLKKAMPPIPIKKLKTKPAKPYKKDGNLSISGKEWFDLLKRKRLPEDYSKDIEIIIGQEEPNPSSNQQIKDWLYSLGWKPQTFKFVRNKETNEVRKIEQVRKEDGEEKVLCDSVLALLNKEPAIKYLEGITVISHRLSILKGFIDNMDDRGYVKAEMAGFTNTLRIKHKICVNLPGVNKPYGKMIRGALIAEVYEELCGSDMASIEDRTKQHYIYEYDPEYVEEMNVPGFDPHLDIALEANMMTKEEVEAYKNGDHSKKPIRHKAKTTNYAATYGVTPEGLIRQVPMKIEEARKLLKAYWKRNWAIKKVADNCKVKIIDGQKWLYNPVSKFWLSLRHDKDRFSTLNQSTSSYCFDRWLGYILMKRKQLTADFHDELVLCIKKGNREKCAELINWAMDKVNQELKLNRKLDCDIQFGESYADIH